MSIDPARVAQNVAALRELIEAHATRPVEIVAVTKRFGPAAVNAVLDAGVAAVGENYAQELVAKAEAVAETGAEPQWHFVGHVQRNKVRQLAPWVRLWHSVDSLRLATEIAKRAPGAGVLVQANMTGVETQSGLAPSEVAATVHAMRGLDLDVRGLMMIGAVGDLVESRRQFAALRAMADDLGLVECSMGMSGDLEVALEEGATIVRVGTRLFGPRPSG